MTNDIKDARKEPREPRPRGRKLLRPPRDYSLTSALLKGRLSKKEKECWINTRVQRAQRDAIDKLIKKGLYVSRSEFLRIAIKYQLRQDLELNNRIRETDEIDEYAGPE